MSTSNSDPALELLKSTALSRPPTPAETQDVAATTPGQDRRPYRRWAAEFSVALDLLSVARESTVSARDALATELVDSELRRITRSIGKSPTRIAIAWPDLVSSAVNSAVIASNQSQQTSERESRQARWATRVVAIAALLAALVLFFLFFQNEGLLERLVIGSVLAVTLVGLGIFDWRAGDVDAGQLIGWAWRLLAPALLITAAAVIGIADPPARNAAAVVIVLILVCTAVLFAYEWRRLGGHTPRSTSNALEISDLRIASVGVLLRSVLALTERRLRNERMAARSWLIVYIFLAALATLAAAGAGVVAASGTSGNGNPLDGLPAAVVAVLGLIGAAAAGLSTALNPGHAWKLCDQRSRDTDALVREIRVMYSVDFESYPKKTKRKAIEYVLDRLKCIQGSSPEPASFWATTPPMEARTPSRNLE